LGRRNSAALPHIAGSGAGLADPVNVPDIKQDLILFDGDCVLCARTAHFVNARFKFTAIQSEFGRALAARFGVDPDAPQTNLAVIEGRALFKSDAAIAIYAALPGRGWARAALVIPKSLRDWLYTRLARNRYALFERRAQCWAGDAKLKARIIERAEQLTQTN